MANILAADLGGTNFRVAVIDDGGVLLVRRSRPLPASRSAADILAAIAELAEECVAAAGTERPELFGLAVPAVVNVDSGGVVQAPNIPDLDGSPAARELGTRLGMRVFLENDATAAAIGEHWKGASASFANVVHITLGTGVGGGLIFDGRPYRGADGTAGELGHICVEPDGVKCGCGSNGCVEQYASATAIVRVAKESGEFGDPDGITAEDLYDRAVRGDAAAKRIFASAGRYLGIALGGLVNALNPDAIVVGGGVANSWHVIGPAIERELKYRAFQRPFERVKLLRSALGDDAGLIGAARVAAIGSKAPTAG